MSETDEILGDIGCELDGSRAEAFVWESPSGDTGTVIFPRGAQQFADDNQVQLIRISGKNGAVEILQEVGADWREVSRCARTAQIKAIKND